MRKILVGFDWLFTFEKGNLTVCKYSSVANNPFTVPPLLFAVCTNALPFVQVLVSIAQKQPKNGSLG